MGKQSDGTVYINTEIDTSGIGTGVSNAKKHLTGFGSALKKVSATFKEAFSGKQSTQGMKSGMTDLESQIKKLEIQLDKLIEKQIRFVETGGNKKSRAFLGMEYDIEMVRNKLEELRLKQEQVNQTASTQKAVSQFSMLRESIARVGKVAGTAALNVLKLAGQGLLKGIKKLGLSLKNIAKSMLSIGKNSKSANGSMLKMLGTSILFSSVFRAISGIINGFKEGMNNLVQYSDDANKTMSSLKSALTQLKNSFATAFTPLLSTVMPILTNFINMLSKAANTVGAFFSALAGKSSYTKAVAVQEDYAESLNGTSKAADKAKKSVNKYFSGLDEIATFTSSTQEENDTATSGLNPADMFKEEQIDISIASFADKVKGVFSTIKELFQNEDWNGLGQYLAEGVNSALGFLYEALNWENVKGKIVPFIDGLTGTFNSFVDNMDWTLLGQTIGNGLNTIIYSIDEFVTGIDWANLGTKLGTGLNGLISEIDFKAAGETFSNSIKGLLDLIINFLEETDWQQIGQSVADFLGSIDWSGIASRLFEGIGAALGGLTAFIWGLIQDAWYAVVQWWREVAFEDGQFTLTGLLEGIWEVAKNIGNWLMENVINPFINGFKEAFGIHSPSTVMAEFGNFIMQGLINGIEDLFNKFKQIFVKIKDTVVNIFTEVKNKVISIWDGIISGIKKAINGIIGAINGMISGITNGINNMISALNSLKFDVPDWVPLIGGKEFSLNISKVSAPQIPYLASGAVIPPNAPFMAVLGDQKHGTNIEAPLDTIKQAVREVVGNGGGGTIHNHLYLDGKEIFTNVISRAELEQMATGRNPFSLA